MTNIHASAFTFYWVSDVQFFKNLEEVKESDSRASDDGATYCCEREKNNGF